MKLFQKSKIILLKTMVQTLTVWVLSMLMFPKQAKGLNFDINVQADAGAQWLLDPELDNDNNPYTALFYGFDGVVTAVSNISFGKPVELRVGLGLIYTTLKGSVQGYDNANPDSGVLSGDSTVASGTRPSRNSYYDITDQEEVGAALIGQEYVARVLVGALWALPRKFALIVDGVFDYGFWGNIFSNGDLIPELVSSFSTYTRYGGILALQYETAPKFSLRFGGAVLATTLESTATIPDAGIKVEVLGTTSNMNYVGFVGIAYDVYEHRPSSNETINTTNPKK